MTDPHRQRRIVDTLVDVRQNRDCFDVSPIPVPLTAEQLHRVLGITVPHGPHPIPTHVVYRGYRIQSRSPP